MATRKQFEIALEKINWKIANSQNGLNDWLTNNEGKRTKILCYGDSHIEVKNDDVFGGEYKGTICFYFKACRVKYDKQNESVSLCPKESNSIFISFHSF